MFTTLPVKLQPDTYPSDAVTPRAVHELAAAFGDAVTALENVRHRLVMAGVGTVGAQKEFEAVKRMSARLRKMTVAAERLALNTPITSLL